MATTTSNTNTLIATFDSYSTAQQAARELESSGISADSIHVDSTQKTAGAGSGSGYQSSDNYQNSGENQESGFSGWWHSLFGSNDDATQYNDERAGYESALASGSAILRATVPASQVDAATEILNRYGAVDVDQNSGSASSPGSTAARGTTGTPATATSKSENGAPIQVVQEELQVGKRAVRRGGVRVYSHLVSQPVEQQINLREEHANVERRPVSREISPEEVSALRDQTIEVTEMAEEAVVAKRARVLEEVVVGKQSSERTETIRDNVRHTEVEVEELDEYDDTASASGGTATSGKRTTPVKGMSPNSPSPSALSGFGTTAGAGTLAGESTTGTGSDLSSSYRTGMEKGFGSESNFEDSPAYEYGSRYAGDSRYKGKSWNDVESDLRSDYERNNPNSTWEQAKNAVRSGWDKVTGQR